MLTFNFEVIINYHLKCVQNMIFHSCKDVLLQIKQQTI